jgi:signal transduction histidine kinase
VTPRWNGARGLVPSRRAAAWGAIGSALSIAVLLLAFIAYRAVGEWERSTLLLVDQRSEEALTLLTVALNRDMKGVHHSVLAPFNEARLDFERRYELEDLFARAFARFPYPESFFVWRQVPRRTPSSVTFNRLDRRPKWAGETVSTGAFPVVSIEQAHVLPQLLEAITVLGRSGRPFAAFPAVLDGVPYQAVVHLHYDRTPDRALIGAVGFTVNLDWVARHYFHEILSQISRIGDVEGSVSLAVVDEGGRTVASTRGAVAPNDVLHERSFPLSFLDADLLGDAADGQPIPQWRLSVSAADDPALLAASRGFRRATWLIVSCTVAVLIAILLTIRALKASADLTAMQSEFVASATHDLKTPLALFQLVAETLAKGRYQSEQAIRAYGAMLSEQTQLLERLIDNVLAYASFRHVAQRYRFERQSVSELVEMALERFDARLATTGLEVNVDIASDLPPVDGDRVSLLQAIDNVLDNAIKYSPQGKTLTIRGRQADRMVRLTVSDQGVGIPAGEREKVFEKFYRGHSGIPGGSGLGLAIARRVVEDHGGTITLRDAEPRGTTVEISLRLHRS